MSGAESSRPAFWAETVPSGQAGEPGRTDLASMVLLEPLDIGVGIGTGIGTGTGALRCASSPVAGEPARAKHPRKAQLEPSDGGGEGKFLKRKKNPLYQVLASLCFITALNLAEMPNAD